MKKCSKDGCHHNVFGGGYCKAHQYLRKDNPINDALTSHKTFSSRRQYIAQKKKDSGSTSLKQCLKEGFGFKSQREMFDWIWGDREHKCVVSGRDLDKVPKKQFHWMFAHILPKGLYTYFKLNPDNIMLLHPDIHVLVDNWTGDMADKHPEFDFDKFFSAVDQMKAEYDRFKINNML